MLADGAGKDISRVLLVFNLFTVSDKKAFAFKLLLFRVPQHVCFAYMKTSSLLRELPAEDLLHIARVSLFVLPFNSLLYYLFMKRFFWCLLLWLRLLLSLLCDDNLWQVCADRSRGNINSCELDKWN